MTRRIRAGLAIAGPALIVSIALLAGGAAAQSPAPSPAAPCVDAACAVPVLADPDATGRELVEAYAATIAAGDVAALGAQLAPGFQIVRANGDHYERDAYLAGGLTTMTRWEIPEVEGTQSGPVLTVYWLLDADLVVDGKTQPTGALPRLTTYVWLDGGWQIAAHANFGATER